MPYKINHLGKVKSSFMLDPQILEEAKIASAKRHQTVGFIVEEALIQYLKLKEIEIRRQFEQKKQNEEHLKRLDMLKQQQEEKERQTQEQLKQNQIDKEIHRLSKGGFNFY